MGWGLLYRLFCLMLFHICYTDAYLYYTPYIVYPHDPKLATRLPFSSQLQFASCYGQVVCQHVRD